MASTRWLLLLMLWLLPWLQMVKSGFSIQRFKTTKTWDSTVIIPKDGVYLVSVIADPCNGCSLSLQVYCRCEGKETFIVQASAKDIVSHAEVAVALRIYNRLYVKKGPAKAEAGSSLSVVYVAGLNSFYITAKNGVSSSRSPIAFTCKHTPNGWSRLRDPDKRTTFTLPRTGMYWVTANIRPCSDPIVGTVQIGSENLFNIYAEKVKAVSNSGPFRFTAGSKHHLVVYASRRCVLRSRQFTISRLPGSQRESLHLPIRTPRLHSKDRK